jgi:Fe-S cluster assembly protein SufD
MEALAEERAFSPDFAAFETNRLGEPPWLSKLRREAFARFQEQGFPSTQDEGWRYTSVQPIARTPFVSAEPGRPVEPLLPRLPGSIELVFVDGRFSETLSAHGGAVDGVRVGSLRQALGSSPERIEPYLSRIAGIQKSSFTALNTAVFEDGALIEVARGAVVRDPIHLLFVSTEGSRASVSHPRSLILLGQNSQATVVESYVGESAPLTPALSHGEREAERGDREALTPVLSRREREGAPYFTNAVTEIALSEGSILDHYKLERESGQAYHVHALEVRQERSTQLTQHNLALGGQLARTDVNVLLDGPGADCVLNGLFVGRGAQHLDNHTVIDHAKPHGTSRELYKGILDGKARGVFHGKIIVRPNAQKTDAMQTNKNLLLSREALVNSTPALEIFADDVKCKHGSTIGQLDPTALFYLRSRGIGEEQARDLLTYAFAADVAGRIRIPAIRAEVEEFLGAALRRATEAA